MYRIVSAQFLAENIKKIEIEAPRIAKKRKAGQFVMIRVGESGERIPLTIAGSDPEKGTITIIVQGMGKSTKELNSKNAGDTISDVVGPLGAPSHIEKFGTTVSIGGGVGTAIAYPTAVALKEAGNYVITINGARSKDLVILEKEMKEVSDEAYITTDDGSYGFHGFVTQKLQELIDSGKNIDYVLAIGPIPMMKAIAEVTRPYKIKTVVSLNPIMVDGTGMCGGCRVSVDNQIKFACVDGPEFDAHLVDFKNLSDRNKIYQTEEKQSSESWIHECKLLKTQHITTKERLAIPRQVMPAQPPEVRIHNFNEVHLGYTPELAIQEALRCIQCKDPVCIKGCPVNIKIDQFIKMIAEGNFLGASKKIKEDNVLPAICGRVCPQEDQCEKMCILTKKHESVAIGNLERFAADYERETGHVELPAVKPSTGKKVAVIGSGPAGLSCANDLIQLGHSVTVFEALHELGGVLVYGIPEFRLPKEIVKGEIEGLKQLGVEFVTNAVAGRSITVDELLKEEHFDAVFIGVGAGLPWFMGIPGENLLGVYSANEFLTRVNLMKSYQFPENDTPVFNCKGKNVAVFGGGNTALDAVRTAKRLGAEHAYIVYRRSEAEMPARLEELHHAQKEGIEFMLLMNPVEFIGNGEQWLTGVKCIRMELGEPDDSGRRRPVPIPDSEFILPIDMAIISIGNGSNPLIKQTTPDIEVSKRDTIVVDINTMATSKKNVYAGGDIVTGGATVILAMGAGRTAAAAIHEKLMGIDAD